jgi:hypothetical protein
MNADVTTRLRFHETTSCGLCLRGHFSFCSHYYSPDSGGWWKSPDPDCDQENLNVLEGGPNRV